MKDNTMQNTQNQDAHQALAGTIIRITRVLLSVFGLGWGIVVLSQTYQSGLSILLTPSNYMIEYTTYFGVGLITVLISYWVVTEEFKNRR